MNNAFTPDPAGQYRYAPPVQTTAHTSVIKIILVIIAAMIAALLGLIVLLLIGAMTGPVGMIIGLICATLPVPIYVMLLLWIDRYEAEPLWMLATAFFWGALVAVFVAFIFNTSLSIIAAVATHNAQVGEAFGAVISAPIVVESSKALILLILSLWKKDAFDGIIEGIVYARMAGLGFAMTENVLYYGRAVQGVLGGLTFI